MNTPREAGMRGADRQLRRKQNGRYRLSVGLSRHSAWRRWRCSRDPLIFGTPLVLGMRVAAGIERREAKIN